MNLLSPGRNSVKDLRRTYHIARYTAVLAASFRDATAWPGKLLHVLRPDEEWEMGERTASTDTQARSNEECGGEGEALSAGDKIK